jgi:hypothetical protein
VCTPHVERHNLTIRMGNRRMTRLTNAFSKKWENHLASLALPFAYYNFCRVHSTLKKPPAMAAGIEDHPWALAELIEKSACGMSRVRFEANRTPHAGELRNMRRVGLHSSGNDPLKHVPRTWNKLACQV